VAERKTILMVTHDWHLASRVGRVVRIADGEIVNDAPSHRQRQEMSHV
jgi:ABC-type lipoprotein export system ATPase subunit